VVAAARSVSRASGRRAGLCHHRSSQLRGPRVPSKSCIEASRPCHSEDAPARYGPLARGPSAKVTKHRSHGRCKQPRSRHEERRCFLFQPKQRWRSTAVSAAMRGVFVTPAGGPHASGPPSRDHAVDGTVGRVALQSFEGTRGPRSHGERWRQRPGRRPEARMPLAWPLPPHGGGHSSFTAVARCRRRSSRRARGKRARRHPRRRVECR
jgi:hypothetical protein